jgi:hypothetical protein
VNKKGLLVAVFFGTILLTSTVAISLPNLMAPFDPDSEVTITGTPADNFPDAQRAQFCGSWPLLPTLKEMFGLLKPIRENWENSIP